MTLPEDFLAARSAQVASRDTGAPGRAGNGPGGTGTDAEGQSVSTSTLDTFLADEKRLSDLGRWLAERSYLTVTRVADHLGCSRETVEGYAMELLPWLDLTPNSKRRTRRYRPTDVLALDAVLRELMRARRLDREEEYLESRREYLRERDRALTNLAIGQYREAA